MPDWSYQTIFRPVLLRLKPQTARTIALGSMGLLSRLPLGRRVIQLMGHMRPDPLLSIERSGIKLRSPAGLGCRLDPDLLATSAFAEFGFGFLEIGPVVAAPEKRCGQINIDVVRESLRLEAPFAAISPIAARDKLSRMGAAGIPVFARIEPSSIDEARQWINDLGPSVTGFIVALQHLDDVCRALAGPGETARARPILFAAIDADAWQDQARRDRCLQAIGDEQIAGIVVVEALAGEVSRQIGKAGFAAALETVRRVRAECGPQPLLIGSVGIHAPADALDYIEAGADLVQVDSGLVFAGPGLPKRINEALLYRRQMTHAGPAPRPVRLAGEAWFWALLMGLSMLAGGALAMLIATTRVVMPYDESLAGLSRRQLSEVNDRLLSFMTHDRVTLAGTMLAVGILYTALAWRGIRRGAHWAHLSVVLSALAGFLSFFSFLGFGYFDPFHAFVTAILFQFLALTVHAPLPALQPSEPPGLENDWRWRASQWGQLLFVVHGAVLIVAGIVISVIGMTTVFVPEDLEFMQTCAVALIDAHPQLVPLVAHDRATFGGMLISCGMATLLPALWGFKRGQAWLWRALMLAGNLAYCSAILVHWFVGYHSLKHLLPAYGGLAWLWAGGIASYWHLTARNPKLDADWEKRLAAAHRPWFARKLEK